MLRWILLVAALRATSCITNSVPSSNIESQSAYNGDYKSTDNKVFLNFTYPNWTAKLITLSPNLILNGTIIEVFADSDVNDVDTLHIVQHYVKMRARIVDFHEVANDGTIIHGDSAALEGIGFVHYKPDQLHDIPAPYYEAFFQFYQKASVNGVLDTVQNPPFFMQKTFVKQ